MKKILVIGGGAMGSAFTVPCLENNNKVIITEPHSKIFIKNLSSKFIFLAIDLLSDATNLHSQSMF